MLDCTQRGGMCRVFWGIVHLSFKRVGAGNRTW
jgi:hypothetical protein